MRSRSLDNSLFPLHFSQDENDPKAIKTKVNRNVLHIWKVCVRVKFSESKNRNVNIVCNSENGGEHCRVVVVAKNSLLPTTPVNFLIGPLDGFSRVKFLCGAQLIVKNWSKF